MTAKSFRIDEATSKKVRELWKNGVNIEEDLKESEIVNYALEKGLILLEIEEVIKNRKRRWLRNKDQG